MLLVLLLVLLLVDFLCLADGWTGSLASFHRSKVFFKVCFVSMVWFFCLVLVLRVESCINWKCVVLHAGKLLPQW